jgi:hypothetical protein
MTGNDDGIPDERAVLHRYLQAARDALVWKLDGLDERAARWPHTPTGTNLLGLVKHAAGVEVDYFGETFGRPWPGPPMPWRSQDAPPNSDMWATPEESVAGLVAVYRSVWAFADELLLSARSTPGAACRGGPPRTPTSRCARSSCTRRTTCRATPVTRTSCAS